MSKEKGILYDVRIYGYQLRYTTKLIDFKSRRVLEFKEEGLDVEDIARIMSETESFVEELLHTATLK